MDLEDFIASFLTIIIAVAVVLAVLFAIFKISKATCGCLLNPDVVCSEPVKQSMEE